MYRACDRPATVGPDRYNLSGPAVSIAINSKMTASDRR